ncbi:MAG: recombination protein RecR [Spirochaetes bacterium]|nr:MAG: recombination protein RecR [Spirochaetota bacterium]
MNALEILIENLAKLPGIGKKSASRIAYYLLSADRSYSKTLADNIKNLKLKIKTCSICGNYTEEDPCSICTDTNRDRYTICVVESPKDITTIETTNEYNGLYHVLMGALSPIDGIGPQDIRIKELIERVRENDIREVIIATNPTVEGETTAQYIAGLVKQVKGDGIILTRLALGIPVGGDLEYTDRLTLARAFQGRNKL